MSSFVTTETKQTTMGGVSPRPKPRPEQEEEFRDTQAAAALAAEPHPGFNFHGGSVVRNPQIITAFWGDWSDASHQQRAANLTQFVTDLLASKYMNILSQYGVGAGAGAAGAVVGRVFRDGMTNPLSEASIQATIQAAIDDGTLPEPGADSVLIIYLIEGLGVTDAGLNVTLCEPTNDNAFGYHSFFTTTAGNVYPYSIVPALDDGCLQNSCANDDGCSLRLAQTQEQRQTQVTSHEFSEMTTNPRGDGWFDDDNGNPENGDICNGLPSTITVGTRTWTVQLMYSKTDDQQSGGNSICVVAPPNPLPSLLP